jgi:hypothetical protein
LPIQSADSLLVVDTRIMPSQVWCAYEHQAVLTEGAPPQVIFVSACRLCDVYKLNEGKTNSDWHSIFYNGGHVLVRIIATGDKADIIRHAQKYARSLQPTPRCNLHGFSIKGGRRAIRCHQTDIVYPSQLAAAEALGLSQGAISQHLDGKISNLNGMTFEYTVAAQ